MKRLFTISILFALLTLSVLAQPLPKVVKPSLYVKVVASPKMLQLNPSLAKTNKAVIWYIKLTNGCTLDFASTNGVRWSSNIICPKPYVINISLVLFSDTNGPSRQIAVPKVYSTTNFITWYYVTNLAALTGRSLPISQPKWYEYFQIRP